MSKQTRKSSSTDIKDSLHSRVQQDSHAECTTSKERVRGRGVMELELHDSTINENIAFDRILGSFCLLGPGIPATVHGWYGTILKFTISWKYSFHP